MRARLTTGEPWFFDLYTYNVDTEVILMNSELERFRVHPWDKQVINLFDLHSHKSLWTLVRYLQEKLFVINKMYLCKEGEHYYLHIRVSPVPYEFSVQVLFPWIAIWNKRYKRTKRLMPFIINLMKYTTIVVPFKE